MRTLLKENKHWVKREGFSEPANLTRRPKGSKLWEAMVRKPESKSFLGKAGFEKRKSEKGPVFFRRALQVL